MFYALIVGNDVYDDKGFANLSGAVRDSQKLANFIRTRFSGANCYDPGQVKIALLTNPTSGEVRRTFDKIVNLLDDDSVFFFYFSGHSICLKGEGEPSLLCRDAMEVLLDGAVGAGEIAPSFITSMSRRGRGNMFFCFDVCRADIFTRRDVSLSFKGLNALCRDVVSKKGREAVYGNRCALTSCHDRESGSDNGSFVSAIIAEWDAALVAERAISVDKEFVERVTKRLRERRQEQRPNFSGVPFTLTPNVSEGVSGFQQVDRRTRSPIRASLAAVLGVVAGLAIGLLILAAVLLFPKKKDNNPWSELSTREAGTRQTLKIGDSEYGFCWIPAGEFDMGSPESEERRSENERLHHVKLSQGFWMLETETTQALYKEIMGTNPSENKGDDLPVETVSWNDAMTFCQELTKRLPKGLKASLPTEAQWEYACRAGTKTAFWYGDVADETKMNCHYNHESGTSPVKYYQPNPWGLYDTLGNDWEWVLDYYEIDYPTETLVDPTGPKTGTNRVLRGGSWVILGMDCRSAIRGGNVSGERTNYWGFRFILTYDNLVAVATTDNGELVDVSVRNLTPQTSESMTNNGEVVVAKSTLVETVLNDSTSVEEVRLESASSPDDSFTDMSQITLNASEWVESSRREAGVRQTVKIGDSEYGFCWIPAGEFDMGSPNVENGRRDDERLHHVKLTRGFWMLETETTQALYKEIMGSTTPSHLRGMRLANPSQFVEDDLPIAGVCYDDAIEFCEELTKRLPKDFNASLPSEAQWEYACRAGTKTPYWFGFYTSREKGNWDSDKIYPVKSYDPNPWGLYDVYGNIGEMCLDCYGDYPTRLVVDPLELGSSSDHVCRGGSCQSATLNCRSASRAKGYSSMCTGFRFLIICNDLETVATVDNDNSTSISATKRNDAIVQITLDTSFWSESPTRKAGTRQTLKIGEAEYGFCWIPAGEFDMGSPESEENRESCERQHRVKLTRGFWMLETETPQLLYREVMKSNPSFFREKSLPVEKVSYDDAMSFCEELTKRLPKGGKAILPTEAQWEYAARAGTSTAYWYGDVADATKMNSDYLVGETSSVGNYLANLWGLYDVYGNVREWVLDSYEDDYPTGILVDTLVSTPSSYRAIRGGSWNSDSWRCRSASRSGDSPQTRDANLGFRFLLTFDNPQSAPEADNGNSDGISASKQKTQELESATSGGEIVDAVEEEGSEVCSKQSGNSVRIVLDSNKWAESLTREAGIRETIKIGSSEYGFCWIPAGEFDMGSPSGQYDNERLHHVKLTKGFWMLETETTQALYKEITGVNPSGFKGDDLPVETVSWDDAIKFCEELTKRLPRGFRASLPTEAQWEYACRAGTKTAYWCGDFADTYAINARGRKTTAVKTYRPNQWWLYDVHGNVWEWVLDFYEKDYPTGTVVNPTGPKTAFYRVFRGGSWYSNEEICRSALRSWYSSDFKSNFLGFRFLLFFDDSEIVAKTTDNGKSVDILDSKTSPLESESVSNRTKSPSPRGRSSTSRRRNPKSPSRNTSEDESQVVLDVGMWSESSTRKAGTRQTLKIGTSDYGFCWIPAGEFDMGSPDSEDSREDCERLHHVKLTKGFWMLETETTQALYKEITVANPSVFNRDDLPVEMISYDDAIEFCEELTKRLPKGLRASLPTEAQWEYACRAGTKTAYWYGDVIDTSKMNSSKARTTPVKSFAANPWGLYDMQGNVWEWVLDCFEKDYPKRTVVDPTGPESKRIDFSVFRGGSWVDSKGSCRSAKRGRGRPSSHYDFAKGDLGFRFILSLD